MMRIPSVVLALVMSAGAAGAQTLTAEDYAEIRNVAQYYNLGYDNSARADGGAVVARSFTPEMAFTRDGGPNWFSAKEMADYAAKATSGTHHWDANIVITPHPEGASVFRYTLVYRVDDSGAPVTISTAGTLQEVWVKNADGWFMKTRYNRSTGGEKTLEFPRFDGRPIAPASPARPARVAAQSGPKGRTASAGKRSLSALDHIEIENLYGWNNIALDSAVEKGEMFARTFTADGLLQIDGRTVTGRKNLAEFAASGEPAMRRWLSNLYIEPSAEGAIGWAYVLTVDGFKATGGTPARAAIQSGALSRDVLVKTPDGWRFKSRTFTPGNGVPASLPLPSVR